MLISTLFVADDIQGDLNSNPGYTWVQIFVNATGSVAGGATMVCVVVIMELFCNVAVLASCSRLVWAFARDKGMPGHELLVKVSLDEMPIFQTED